MLLKSVGLAFVTGHAIFLRPDNTFLVCCYSPVLAFPDTPYTREIVAVMRDGKSPGPSPFSENGVTKLDLHASCDHHGNFKFYDLHAYRYFFAANVYWMKDGNRQGGTLLTSITLAPGDNFLILTNITSRGFNSEMHIR